MVILLWLALGLLTATIATEKGRQASKWLLVGLTFPMFGLVAAALSTRKNKKVVVNCPRCGGEILMPITESTSTWSCPHCQHDFVFENGHFKDEGAFRQDTSYNDDDRKNANNQNGHQSTSKQNNDRDHLEQYYQILNCSKDATKEEIKKQYRRLIIKNHPDHLMAQGASNEEIERANKKISQIKHAYEVLEKAVS